MDYVNKQENYEFWKARINNSKEKVCSNDENLSLLESGQIIKRITQGSSVLEVGCATDYYLKNLIRKLKILSTLVLTCLRTSRIMPKNLPGA